MSKLNVAILGATGAVGQRFIQLLEGHPWFHVHELAGHTSAGQRYGDAVHWILDDEPPGQVMDIMVKPLNADFESPLVFSALPKDAAMDLEPELARRGHIVCTNASAHRMAYDVPLLLPEINADHIHLIDIQREKRGWTTGALIANSNCTAMPVVMALKPLIPFGIEKLSLVSEQALSGAGYPGVASLDAIDNVIPYVPSDEEKLETETLKMLGQYLNDGIEPLSSQVSATCTRVPVIDGHLVMVSMALKQAPSLEEVLSAWKNYEVPADVAQLPSAPNPFLQYLSAQDRPQIRRDRMAGAGMTCSVGRLRECPVLGYKFVTLAHNTIRGAAGCSILNAELLARRGYIHSYKVTTSSTMVMPSMASA